MYVHLIAVMGMIRAILTLHGLAEEEAEEYYSKKSNVPCVVLKTILAQTSAVAADLWFG